jgi:hypothetical protein
LEWLRFGVLLGAGELVAITTVGIVMRIGVIARPMALMDCGIAWSTP